MNRSATLLALCSILPACQSPTTAELSADDVAAIRAQDASFARLAENGDFRALVASYYTADAVLMPPNERAATGHAQIEAALRALPPIQDFKLHTEEVSGHGDLAYSRGTYTLKFAPPGQAPRPDSGKFIEVFRRQSDGTWRVSRDIFNSDLPPVAN